MQIYWQMIIQIAAEGEFMDFSIEGLDKLEKQLTNLSNKAESLNGEHEVTISNKFVSSHSKYASMRDLLDDGGFTSIEEADDDKFDKFLNENTDFNSWADFQSTLAQEYFIQELGL